jgi:cyanophycinase
VRRVALDACPLAESTQVLRPDPVPEARLVLLGSAPVRWPTADVDTLRRELVEPVGVLATASGEPTAMAERYLDWLISHGIRAELLPIALHNIERASRDRALLRTLQRVGSLLLTGGDQRRLVEALLHCAEATPVLHTLVTAFERGTPLIAVAASAAALGERMIAEGDSVDALRFGSDEDASTAGVVVERGIGLTRLGLIDQNFLRRRRLGRLLIACVEQRQRFGFGLCEGSGMIVHGNDREIEAIGKPGVVIAEIDLDRARLAPGVPDPAGIRLYILEEGQRVTLEQLASATFETSRAAAQLLQEALGDLARDYRAAQGERGSPFDLPRWEQSLQARAALH